jgi:hypothetical protein
MNRLWTSMLAVAVMAVFAGSAHAIMLIDLAKDSHELVRGEFTALERTVKGDRMQLRIDTVLNGTKKAGDVVWIEPYEPAYSDRALGEEAIVGFYESAGKYYFVWHPVADRAVIMEFTDHAPDGLNQNEQALRRFLAINEPHSELIRSEFMRRFELENLSYPGEFPQTLLDDWKAELLNQMAWRGTVAARDAAKTFVDHPLFRNTLSTEELRYVGSLVAASQPGSMERGYILEIIRNEFSAHPELSVLDRVLREETSTAVVGKLTNIYNAVQDRGEVLTRLGTIAVNREEQSRVRMNALQVLAGLADVDGISWLHDALTGEMEAYTKTEQFDKGVLRRVFMALDRTRHGSSTEVLEAFFETDICKGSWELTRRAWRAYSLIDTRRTNSRIREEFHAREEIGQKSFFGHLTNEITRELIMIHNED